MNPPGFEVPEDLLWALDADAKAYAAFQKISASHRKEYVRWIEKARQPMTRARRLQEVLYMLAEGKRLLSQEVRK